MDRLFNRLETPSLLLGRALLGIYFIIPALRKISNSEATLQSMVTHGVPFAQELLPLTILLQLVLGVFLIIGFKTKYAAFVLAGLTLVISLFMHSFWNLPEGGHVPHELQNFVKNMGIMAGLLVLSARGSAQFSVDTWLEKR